MIYGIKLIVDSQGREIPSGSWIGTDGWHEPPPAKAVAKLTSWTFATEDINKAHRWCEEVHKQHYPYCKYRVEELKL